jgi:lauroyl/myristoyl acyltransferase
MRLVPRHRRFAAAVYLSTLLEPIIRRTRQYRLQERAYKVDSAAEISLYFVLYAMTKHGVTFDTHVEVTNYPALREAVEAGTGVLLIAPHTMLLHLLFRRLHEDGFAPVGLTSENDTRLVGTAVPAETLQPSSTFLLNVRTQLRRRRLVCGMPDRAEHHRDRTVELETAKGRIIFAPALIRLAARAGARVLFAEVHLDRGRAIATIAAPEGETSIDVAAAFMRFVQAHVESHGERRE